jgi:hypothetical protein
MSRRLMHLRSVTGVLALVVVSGCGGGDGTRRTAVSGSVGEPRTKLERARVDAQLKFARCMRKQGLDFPDPRPQPDGSYLHEPPADPGERAAYNRAGATCVKHFDAIRGVEMTPAERRELAEAIDRDRAFARCMRERGYRWPDPIPAEGGFRVDDLEAAGIDADDPRVARDERVCMRRAGQPVPKEPQP